MKRKRYTKEFKAKVALEAVKSQKTVSEIAAEFGVLVNQIEEYTRHPFYGRRKRRAYLNRLGYPVNRKRVQRLMRKMRLASIAPKPNTSRKAPERKVYPYLLRGLVINRPNQVWCSDLTYIPLEGGFCLPDGGE